LRSGLILGMRGILKEYGFRGKKSLFHDNSKDLDAVVEGNYQFTVNTGKFRRQSGNRFKSFQSCAPTGQSTRGL
jgi:hypothetical protein